MSQEFIAARSGRTERCLQCRDFHHLSPHSAGMKRRRDGEALSPTRTRPPTLPQEARPMRIVRRTTNPLIAKPRVRSVDMKQKVCDFGTVVEDEAQTEVKDPLVGILPRRDIEIVP